MKFAKFMKFKMALVAMASLAVSCSVEDTHDLSKDIDMTVAVGNGISIPIGSTERIMLTEMIDPESSDVIAVDGEGNYSIKKEGTIEQTTVDIEVVKVAVEPISKNVAYSLNQEVIDREALDRFPSAIREQILNNTSYTHIVNQVVDKNTVDYTLNMDVPEGVEFLEKVYFEEPKIMTIDIDIYTTDGNKAFAEKIKNIHLHTEGEGDDHFYIKMPQYIVFDNSVDLGPDNKLYLDGETTDKSDNHKHIIKEFKVLGIDFSRGNTDGGIKVSQHKIKREETLEVKGVIISDPLTLTVGELIDIPQVFVDAKVSFEEFIIKEVYGKFNPDIAPVKIDDINIDMGKDMDFVYDDDAKFRFTNPELYVNIDNGASVPVITDVYVSSYTRENTPIASNVYIPLTLSANNVNHKFVTFNGASCEGYDAVAVPTFKTLLDKVPGSVEINVEPKIDNTKIYSMELGKPMIIKGDYTINIPMEFDELELEYTETIEDVLGNDPTEITDYVKDIKSVTLSAKAFNTCPVEFTPNIVAYDANGRKLENIVAEVVGSIAKGTGYTGEPAESSFKIKLSALNGELEQLNTIDVVFKGKGAGVLNEKSYLQLKEITLTVDQPIIVDMN